MPTLQERAHFRHLWLMGAALDKLDAWGSQEQRRVYREWVAEGCPAREPGELPVWLWRHANKRSDGSLPPDPRPGHGNDQSEPPHQV